MMADEAVVFDGDALADKRVRADFAAGADVRVFLDLDECADFCFVADRTTIEVDEGEDSRVLAQSNVRGNSLVRRSVGHSSSVQDYAVAALGVRGMTRR
jgi:hypothetical protein